MTKAQISRLNHDLAAIAGEPVTITEIGGTIYALCSELAALRLFHKYQNPAKCRAALSQNLKTWYFSIEQG